MAVEDSTLDINKILHDKLGSKVRFVPKFVVNWLKKILHQDWLNSFLDGKGKGKEGLEWLDGCVELLDMTMKVQTNIDGVITEGLDALPGNEDGRYFTIVSNHPLGGPDGVALGDIVCRKWNEKMVLLVNDILMNLKGLAPMCVPVNKTGRNGRDLPRMIDEAFRSEKNAVVFPAGICSRKHDDGSISDLEWKKTFVTKSVQYHRDVIPVHFSGQNSDKFYNIARWCKKLHLKINVAMLYLVDETYKNRGKTFTITFGKPIPWQTFDKSKTDAEWAQWVRAKVYEMGKDSEE